MAEERFLRDYPELGQFVLSDVQLTGTRIGGGAYGKVDEVDVPVRAAAKTIYAFLQEADGSIPADQLPKAASEFVNECQLMSKLRHPNFVQFLGVTFFPDSRLPALVMERLLTSLHDLLDPETPPPPGVHPPISFFSLVLRIIVLQNVASGLAYLHGRTPQVIHRDLSARNVLLDSEMVAKIADLGMARIMRERAAATMTKGPGASVYMPPEASAPAKSNKEKSKYDASIDVFSLGVVTIFTIGGVFPCDPLEPNYFNDETGFVVARTELQRRSEYMRHVNEHLRAYGQLRGDHPLIRLVQQSLHNGPHKRPSIQVVQGLLEEARAGIRDGEIERKKRELVRSLQTQPMKQNLKHVLRDLVTENAVKDQQLRQNRMELAESQQQLRQNRMEFQQQLRQKEDQLQSSEREKQAHCSDLEQQLRQKKEQLQLSERERRRVLDESQQQLRQKEVELREKETELRRAEETIRKEQQQIQDKDKEIALLQQQPPRSKSQQLASYTCQVSGPGLTSATVNYPTYVLVELTNYSDRLQLNVTAQLQLVSKATPTKSWFPWSKKQPQNSVPVAMTTPSRYEVSYTAVNRGQHILHVQVNDREINGSPFRVTVYPDPSQLDHPVRTVTGLNNPYGIAINNHEQMIVSECFGHRVSIFDIRGKKIGTFGSEGDRPDQMKYPRGIATDDTDNIYVSSNHKVQKFTSSGELIKCIGRQGSKEEEFNYPHGITVYNNQVYVCDRDNHRIQVFDLDLNFVRSIGSHGIGRGEFDAPLDVKFDAAGNMYVTEWRNSRVQVLDSSDGFIQLLGLKEEEGKGELSWPSGLHIADKYVYVSDFNKDRIVVYETSGQFVTSFGRRGSNDGKFRSPYCITSCVDGYIHVCDYGNNRVQIF